MSARPGPSGGYHVSGIPTGISSTFMKIVFLWVDECNRLVAVEKLFSPKFAKLKLR